MKLETGEHLTSFVDITLRKEAEDALQRSEEAATRLAQENATVAEIGQIISSTLNIEEVYERFAEEVRKVLPFDRVSVNTMDPDLTSITITYTFGVKIGDSEEGIRIYYGKLSLRRNCQQTIKHSHPDGGRKRVSWVLSQLCKAFPSRTSIDDGGPFDIKGSGDRHSSHSIAETTRLYGIGCEAG